MSKYLKLVPILVVILVLYIFLRSKIASLFELPPFNYCKNCNVIVITLTNLRYDHLSQNGYFRPTSPNLDSFASESLIFDNAFSHSSWTLPEGISIFSSLYPFTHGVMNRFDGSVLSKNTPTLVDVLNKEGYKTAAFTGGFDYDPRFGLTNRYGEYQDCSGQGEKVTTLGYGKIGCAASRAINWIKNNHNSKFFVHIQGYDAHCPFSQKGGKMYDPGYIGSVDFSSCLWTFDKSDPIVKNGKKYYSVYSSKTGVNKTILLSEDDVKHLIALYDESITDGDAVIGTFLDQIKDMGLDKNTIIVFTSEHGDMFGKYGIFMRGGPLRGTFYDDVLHIPLIIKIPGIKPSRFSQLVEQIDIAPTILDLLLLKSPSTFQGESLIPVLQGGKEVHKFVFAGSEYQPGIDNVYFNESTRIEAIRGNDWKLIEETTTSQNPPSSKVELYQISQDKEELKNVADSDPDVVKNLLEKLSQWSQKIKNEN